MTTEPQNEKRKSSALKCWFLTGATCSGKTDLSLRLAERLNAEIIALDSMTVYRGMDIGTAKPSLSVREQIPHHLIDIRDPTEDFSVSQYCDMAHEIIDRLRANDQQALFVGGTPLYLKAMLRGLFSGPSADWDFRKEIEKELEQLDLAELRKRIEQVDPLAAHHIHPNDKRRMIRALEVFQTTGIPISHQQTQFDEGTDGLDCNVFALRRDRSELHERINARVDQMLVDGLEDEIRGLLDQHGELSLTAMQAVGYPEVIEFWNGETDLETMTEKIKIRTRRFARRQETWFRGLSEVRFVEIEGEPDPNELAEQIIELGANHTTSEGFGQN